MTKRLTQLDILAVIFKDKFVRGAKSVEFTRDDINSYAALVGLKPPKNPGAVIWSYRFGTKIPKLIRKHTPKGMIWILRLAGTSRYRFALVRDNPIVLRRSTQIVHVPDATPALVVAHARGDEQALLARIRYNRLVDLLLGVVSYSLQSHMKTSAMGLGRLEVDELYVAVDANGNQSVVPVQAKVGSSRISVVQTEQDFTVCSQLFPNLTCRPVAARFVSGRDIALFELRWDKRDEEFSVCGERRFRLIAGKRPRRL